MKNSSILNKSFKKINNRLGKVTHHFSSGDIRLFRVEVKKLSAMLRLMKPRNDDKPFELPQKLNKFYSAVGTIRTLQLLQKRIRHTVLKSKPEILQKAYLELLTGKIKHSTRHALSMVKSKNPFKQIEQQLKKEIDQKSGAVKMNKFAWTEVSTLKNLLGSAFNSDESLYSIRKLLKDMLYTWPYIKKEVRAILPSVIYCSKADLRFIARRVGKFHDVSTSINHLHEDRATHQKDKKDQLLFTILESSWQKEKDTLRTEIHNFFQKRIPTRQGFSLLVDGHKSEIENKLMAK